jgi:predicted metal-binding protein
MCAPGKDLLVLAPSQNLKSGNTHVKFEASEYKQVTHETYRSCWDSRRTRQYVKRTACPPYLGAQALV